MFSVTRTRLLKDHGARCGAPVAVRRADETLAPRPTDTLSVV